MIQFKLLQNIPNYQASITLDGAVWQFTFRHNQYDESWFVSIDDVVSNIKAVNGVDILKFVRYLNVPPGELIIQRLAGKKSKPGFDNFGADKEMTLSYTPVAEVA